MLTDPDRGRVEVFGRPPREAVRQGLVGVMLQAGALLHEATVNDVLRLMQGLHAHPLELPEVIERADLGSSSRPRPRSCPVDRPSGCGTRWRSWRTRSC